MKSFSIRDKFELMYCVEFSKKNFSPDVNIVGRSGAWIEKMSVFIYAQFVWTSPSTILVFTICIIFRSTGGEEGN